VASRAIWGARTAVTVVLMALAFFLSVPSPEATEPNAMINLAFVAGLLLAVGLLLLGVGLIRERHTARPTESSAEGI
jgi:hypothetical protein